MALTISNLTFTVVGIGNQVRGQLAGDASYTTGGYSLTPALVGLSAIDYMEFEATAGFVPEYDYTAQKVKLRFVGSALLAPLAEVTGGASVTAYTGARFRANGV